MFPCVALPQQRFTPSCAINPSLVSLLALICFAFSFQSEARATTLPVPAGGNFQAALDAAQLGDTIVLAAGAIYPGPFTLPNKPVGTGTDADYITIRTGPDDTNLPPGGVRISPAYSPALAQIVSPGSAYNALNTAPGAHHYKFIGIEFRPVDANAFLYDLLFLGNVGANQNTLAQVPHHLQFDRCYIHAFATQSLKRGIALNTAETSISNCYISGFKVMGQEAQAILGWNGPGPFHIVNNYLEAAGENLMFGGSDPSIPNLIPSDIEVRRNTLTKLLAWKPSDPTYAGVRWVVKNVLELKNARRVLIDGNVIENSWRDAQDGTGILFTVRNQDGTAPWSTVEDVQFTNNIVRHMSSAINLLGRDYFYPSQVTSRVAIKNNLFYDIDGPTWGGNGTFLNANGGTDISFEHNTVLQSGNVTIADSLHTRFVFNNNLVRANQYGVIGTGHGIGTDTLGFYFPGAVFTGNVMIAPTNYPWLYPGGNYYAPSMSAVEFTDVATDNYRLLVSSPYKSAGSDGKDIGTDFDALDAALAGAGISPTPTPTPTPTGTNVALASNGAVARASSTYNNYPASAALDGDRKGLNWGTGGGWNDATSSSYPDWLEVAFRGSQTISEIDLYTLQDNYGNPAEPTDTLIFTQYGVTAFDVQYFDGVTWQTVPGASVTSNNLVKRKFSFAPVTTAKIRIVVNNALAGYSRITEVEAFTGNAAPTPTPTPDPTPAPRVNVALAATGAAATASSSYSSNYPVQAINDGERKGLNWGAGGGWNDATVDAAPDWVEVKFADSKSITEIDVFTLQDNYTSPLEPTLGMPFSQYGLADFEVQYWTGAGWANVPGGAVTGNRYVWRQFIFSAVTTPKIRVLVNNSLASYSRIVEVEAY